MTRFVYLVGPPGVGKSTALATVVEQLGLTREEPELLGTKLLWGEPLMFGDELGGYLLGKPHDDFPGTDRLSMSVSPEAVNWLSTGDLPRLLFAEGSRLGNGAFLVPAARLTDLLVIHLVAHRLELDRRCDLRAASDQKESFRLAADTRAARAADLARDAGATVVQIDTTYLQPVHVADAIHLLV